MRRRWGRWALLIYVVLLAASHVVRRVRAQPFEPRPDERVTMLPELDGDGEHTGEEARVVWQEKGTGVSPDRLPVLLLHGSPGRKSHLVRVAAGLSPERRTVLPDLPGFGSSQAEVADYSIRAHARYVLALLDQLGIERCHVVGFSLGGGVGIELGELAPERVASLALVSSIGVQELELFGDYHLNHAVHWVQLAFLWELHELVPHFGLLDDSFLSLAYARNFYDTDQRPLRGILERWHAPTLIIHGPEDPLVPLAAAEEHHRIVPQSELQVMDGSHFLVFRRGEEVGGRIEEFVRRAETDLAVTRDAARPERIAAAGRPFDPATVPPFSGFGLLIFLVLVALATLVSEDLTCIGVGALVGQGRVDFLPGVTACIVGIYVGDLLLFLAGRLVGRRILRYPPWRWLLSEARVERSSVWFERRGPVVIFLSRFMPGLRLPTYFASGVLRTSVWRFSFWFALAAIVWTPILVWIASRIGGALSERVDTLHQNLGQLLLATLVVGFVLVKVVRPLLSHRGRRLFLSTWRRATRWEFWPRWAFYPPIVLACLWFGLRRRRLLAFTAANPAIPHGGFIGESKADILAGLAGATATEPERVARTLVLRADEGAPSDRLPRALAFREENGLGWPLVVKPDVGQRGDGVSIVRSEAELADALAAAHEDVLLQEYLTGDEYGLFYVRHPERERGELFSIVTKELTAVVGDGETTLERLILDDDRTVCQARFFLDRHGERLAEVPAAGERVTLAEIGTHCRGAVFRDGRELGTPELEAAVDEIARGYPGFFIGRFDVRAESSAELAAGRFRILELNGVTSEAAHVYDPRHSVIDAWRTIGTQWSLAYEIGAANARNGTPTSRPLALLRALLSYRRRARGRGV